jgi:hypothetical protein
MKLGHACLGMFGWVWWVKWAIEGHLGPLVCSSISAVSCSDMGWWAGIINIKLSLIYAVTFCRIYEMLSLQNAAHYNFVFWKPSHYSLLKFANSPSNVECFFFIGKAQDEVDVGAGMCARTETQDNYKRSVF